MSAIQWQTVQRALQSWIVTGTGLAGSHVIWTGQNGDVPSGVYCELRLTVLPRFGRDWIDHAVVGGDYVASLRGPRRAVFTVQCFQSAGGTSLGDESVMAVLDNAMSAYALESVTTALVAAGIGVSSIDAIQGTDGVLNSVRNEQRAVVAVHINLVSEIVETTAGQGWISNVNADGESDLAPVSIDVSDT